jgi:tetraacyldisaccharide 4'-kinase
MLRMALLPATIPLSFLYRAGVAFRNHRYDRGAFSVGRLPSPVVSVGNVTTGGSGKTPVVAALARTLAARGQRVAVLSRGYGRRSRAPFVLVSDGKLVSASVEESGDEPLELARDVPGLAVGVGADRLDVGRKLHELLAPDVFVLDDGFQHRRLGRNLDLVCIDAAEDLSKLRLLPAGSLREPLSSLRRADAIVWTRWSEERSMDEARRFFPRSIPEIRLRSRIVRLTRLGPAPEELPGDAFRNESVGVLLGIARPERVLESLPARAVFRSLRADHHWWSAGEVAALVVEARKKGAVALLTTKKDAVKMGFLSEEKPLPLPIFAIVHEAEIVDRSKLEELLASVYP